MTIGFAGSHRTGKSTLARAFVEKNKDFKLVETGISGVYSRLGLDPKAMYPFKKRLEIQRHILDELVKQYRESGLLFVADRTPIDFIAYTLADIVRDNYDGSDDAELSAYIKDCYDATNIYFSVVLVVQPGIKVTEGVLKAPANMGYMEHINALVLGLTTDPRLNAMHFALNRGTTDLEARVAAVENVIRTCRERVLRDCARTLH